MVPQQQVSPEKKWRERLIRYQSCRLTVAQFCEREGVSRGSFYRWKRRFSAESFHHTAQPQRSQTSDGSPLFVPVSVQPAAEVQIELPGGAIVRLPAEADQRLLRSCIQAAAHLKAEGDEC